MHSDGEKDGKRVLCGWVSGLKYNFINNKNKFIDAPKKCFVSL
jgi:hypothetical protein